MEELYRQVAAKFLVDSHFRAEVQMPRGMGLDYHQPVLPESIAKERIRYDMTEMIMRLLMDRFGKEIKVESTGPENFEVDRYSLEFMAFTMPQFKLMVEFIIAEMPSAEIDRIRQTR